jgi:hypothetical protein
MTPQITMITVATMNCFECGRGGTITLPVAEWEAYKSQPAQTSLRSLSPAEREQIISGIHPACWDIMMGNEPK